MLGTVQINNLNLKQGELTSVENYMLFTGIAATDCQNTGKIVTIDQSTDLDAVLGATASDLKTQVTAARLNAGQNWHGCVLPYTVAESTPDALDAAFESAVNTAMEHVKVEAIIRTDPVTRATSVEAMQALAESIMAKYMRPLWIMGRAPQFTPASQTFADYQALASALQAVIAADQVMLTVSLWGHEMGTLAGRLASEAVTVADSPMRVATGALVGVWSNRPTDKTGRVIDLSVLKALDAARRSGTPIMRACTGATATCWTSTAATFRSLKTCASFKSACAACTPWPWPALATAASTRPPPALPRRRQPSWLRCAP